MSDFEYTGFNEVSKQEARHLHKPLFFTADAMDAKLYFAHGFYVDENGNRLTSLQVHFIATDEMIANADLNINNYAENLIKNLAADITANRSQYKPALIVEPVESMSDPEPKHKNIIIEQTDPQPEGYDSEFAEKHGTPAEKRFKKIAESMGFAWEKAKESEDVYWHIDCYIERDGARLAVDVKGRKKNHRHGSYNDNAVWIEMKNITGKLGWLYGRAHLIAFEQEHGFLVVQRAHLAAYTEKVLQGAYRVDQNHLAYHNIYTRKGQLDEITRLSRIEILSNCSTQFWQ